MSQVNRLELNEAPDVAFSFVQEEESGGTSMIPDSDDILVPSSSLFIDESPPISPVKSVPIPVSAPPPPAPALAAQPSNAPTIPKSSPPPLASSSVPAKLPGMTVNVGGSIPSMSSASVKTVISPTSSSSSGPSFVNLNARQPPMSQPLFQSQPTKPATSPRTAVAGAGVAANPASALARAAPPSNGAIPASVINSLAQLPVFAETLKAFQNPSGQAAVLANLSAALNNKVAATAAASASPSAPGAAPGGKSMLEMQQQFQAIMQAQIARLPKEMQVQIQQQSQATIKPSSSSSSPTAPPPVKASAKQVVTVKPKPTIASASSSSAPLSAARSENGNGKSKPSNGSSKNKRKRRMRAAGDHSDGSIGEEEYMDEDDDDEEGFYSAAEDEKESSSHDEEDEISLKKPKAEPLSASSPPTAFASNLFLEAAEVASHQPVAIPPPPLPLKKFFTSLVFAATPGVLHSQIAAKVRARGGEVFANVSRNTTCLLTTWYAIENQALAVQQARTMGIPILNASKWVAACIEAEKPLLSSNLQSYEPHPYDAPPTDLTGVEISMEESSGKDISLPVPVLPSGAAAAVTAVPIVAAAKHGREEADDPTFLPSQNATLRFLHSLTSQIRTFAATGFTNLGTASVSAIQVRYNERTERLVLGFAPKETIEATLRAIFGISDPRSTLLLRRSSDDAVVVTDCFLPSGVVYNLTVTAPPPLVASQPHPTAIPVAVSIPDASSSSAAAASSSGATPFSAASGFVQLRPGPMMVLPAGASGVAGPQFTLPANFGSQIQAMLHQSQQQQQQQVQVQQAQQQPQVQPSSTQPQ